jgi:hypothetical protein
VPSVLIDAGPLIALFDRDDKYLAPRREVLVRTKATLVTTWPVVTESSSRTCSTREALSGNKFYLMCDDISGLAGQLRAKKIRCSPVQDRGWGLLSWISLPGGGKLGVYQPHHARPRSVRLPRRTAGWKLGNSVK